MMSIISMRAQPSFRPPELTVGTFGEKLRKQREQRGISLDTISTITKISPRMLRAIEDEHFDQLPGGVFSKGFVRAYARQVGLNEEEAVADYLTALRENQIQSQTVLPNFGSVAAKSATDRAELNHRNPDRDNGVRGSDFKSPVLGHTHNGSLYHNDEAAGLQSRPRRTDDRRKEVRRSGDREVDLNKAVGHQVRPHEDFPEELRLSKGLLGKDLPGRDLPGNDLLRKGRSQESLDHAVPYSPLSFLNLSSAASPLQPLPKSQSEPASAPAPIPANSASHRVPWEKLAAALLVITVILTVWTLRRYNRPVAHQSASSSGPTPAPTVPVPVPDLASTKPVAAAASQPVARAPRPAALANQAAAVTSGTDVKLPVTKPHASATAASSPRTFTLLIRADQTSWVVISADGQPAAKETLIAPAHTSVRASHEIIVRAGNAAGISFLLNGKEIPTHSTPGEVGIFTFDANGMRASTSAQATTPAR
jgi:cytoskeletal protein RodZ